MPRPAALRGAALQVSDGSAIVSFRGTLPDSLRDWIDDLDTAASVPYGGCSNCEVHDGFRDSWNALKGQVLTALNGLSPYVVHVTGHSLGGAIAVMAAFELQAAGYSIGEVITFGQPRVGNQAFADVFARGFPGHFRATHWKDVVPHLPPELLLFEHARTEVFYNEANTNHMVCNGSGEDPACSDQFDVPDSVDDHLHYLGIPISNLC